MFTGIITELGIVKSVSTTADGMEVSIHCPITLKESLIGDSISINGVCLTVKEVKGETGYFDVSHETLKVTTTKHLKIGDIVNIEPAMKLNSRVGGHLVSGHVEDTGKILDKVKYGNSERITISAGDSIMQYIIKKGSVAVDGISLTVVDVSNEKFTVVIIPHTSKMTTLGFKRVGDIVNLEPDMIAKYVVHYLSKYSDARPKEENLIKALQKSGYI